MSRLMTLHEWCEQNPEKAKRLPEVIGIHPKSVARYRSGARIPKKDEMKKIRAFTNGQVDANSFYHLDGPPPRRNGAAKGKLA